MRSSLKPCDEKDHEQADKPSMPQPDFRLQSLTSASDLPWADESRGTSVQNCSEYAPVSGHAFEFVHSQVFKRQPPTGYRVAHGLRDWHSTCNREGRNTYATMHCDSGKVVTRDFAFSGV